MKKFIVSYTNLKGELNRYELSANDENHAEQLAKGDLGLCKINWICAKDLSPAQEVDYPPTITNSVEDELAYQQGF